jgi:hypothetical protein
VNIINLSHCFCLSLSLSLSSLSLSLSHFLSLPLSLSVFSLDILFQYSLLYCFLVQILFPNLLLFSCIFEMDKNKVHMLYRIFPGNSPNLKPVYKQKIYCIV